MAKLYGWGAAVVILGALFKLLHWQGADYMLIVGLGTESIIFFFSAFEKPHEEVDWSLVYPELAGMEGDDDEKKKKSNLTPTQELDNMLEEAKINGALIESLGQGLTNFGEAASKLNQTIEAAASTQQYNEEVAKAAKNMESLNALYEVQLQSSNRQSEASQALVESLATTAEDSKRLQAEVASLAQNLGALNNVYGNMLSAMGGGNKS
ncbi:MAG: gliding motility protein GldL [Flavobacteriales bacterium]|nr:gliding motility protein GldL [Flavobacteriales bacterium]